MKKIYLNLERFDVPKIFDGISKFEKNESYGSIIGSGIENMDLALPVYNKRFPCTLFSFCKRK